MSKRSKLSHINISKKNYNTILRWSLSLKEIGGLCFGKHNSIQFVERLANLSDSRHYYSWDIKERNMLIQEYRERGLELISEYHSHSCKGHNSHPSAPDIKYFKNGIPHLICFPLENKIRCWLLSKSLKKTKGSEIIIKVN